MQEARHVEGRAFRIGEIAGSKRVADAVAATTLDEQVAAVDGSRAISCECGCETVGIHNHNAKNHNLATTGKQYA